MASAENPETLVTHGGDLGISGFEFGFEEADLAELDSDVKRMAEKIAESRANLPEQLRNNLASILSDARPVLPDDGHGLPPGQSGEQSLDMVVRFGSNKEASLACKEHKDVDKAILLKEKISSNLSAVPVVIQRMKECIATMEKLDSSERTIPQAFKRKRT